jgi:ABC-type branched-subunit amino acid transport system substrate-binding protein
MTNAYSFPVLGRRAILGSAIALGLTLGACGETTETGTTPPPDTAGPSTDALKLGTLLPITGDLAQYGGPMQDAATLLVQTVNDCGGVLGQDVILISEDDQTDPAAGASAMSKLAEVDQVSGVVGAAASSVSSAAVDIAVRNQVVEISPSATSPVFTDRAKAGDFNGFWFRTAPPDTFQGQALAQLAIDQGYETVAVMGINNDYGSGLVQSFTEAYTALGGTVVNQNNPTLYPPDASSFDSEIRTVFSGSPDAVMLVAYPETGSLILQAAFEQGLLGGDTQVLLTDGMKDASIAELVGRDSDGSFVISGVLGTAPSAGGPGLEQFITLYTAAFNRDPSVFDPNTWDATALLVLAAEAAGDTSGPAIRDNIRNVANAPGTEVSDVCEALALIRQGEEINFQGASGPVDLDDQGDVVGSYDIWTVGEDGQIEVKETIEISG